LIQICFTFFPLDACFEPLAQSMKFTKMFPS